MMRLFNQNTPAPPHCIGITGSEGCFAAGEYLKTKGFLHVSLPRLLQGYAWQLHEPTDPGTLSDIARYLRASRGEATLAEQAYRMWASRAAKHVGGLAITGGGLSLADARAIQGHGGQVVVLRTDTSLTDREAGVWTEGLAAHEAAEHHGLAAIYREEIRLLGQLGATTELAYDPDRPSSLYGQLDQLLTAAPEAWHE